MFTYNFKGIFLLAFFGFFRLASLVPVHEKSFDNTRFPLVQDVIWTADGCQFILKCAKNMQESTQFKVIQIPKISCEDICPVRTLKQIINFMKLKPKDPLFIYIKDSRKVLLTTFKVRNVLACAVRKMDLNPI